jgi:uncharacterized membrane protein YbhN (UPF0104 family)
MRSSSPVVAPSGESSSVLDAPPSPSRPVRRRRWAGFLGMLLLLLAGAAAISMDAVNADSGSDLWALTGSIAVACLHLRWQFVCVVVALAALHYVATAVAARAASGLVLPFRETVLVQLAAAAANRLTPAGIGGAALNARFYTRRGLAPSAALGAVAVLAVMGGTVDFIVLALLVVLGPALGLGGASQELSALTTRVTHTFTSVRSPWLWAALALGVAAVLARQLLKRRRPEMIGQNQFWRPIVSLARHPRLLATLVFSSGLTTLILGFAFVAATAMVPGPRPAMAVGALLVAFMLGSAAATSVPIPAGLGTTEAALIGVLVSAQVPTGHAVEVVLIFRLLTFWLPALMGVLAMRHLHRHDAI